MANKNISDLPASTALSDADLFEILQGGINNQIPWSQIKAYVDNQIASNLAGINWKQSVKAATTANITLSGTQTIDGISCGVGDRVLVKNQSTASQNGIYVVASGSWTRSTDCDSSAEFQNAVVSVDQGTANADTSWRQTADSVTVGSTSIAWTSFGAAGVSNSASNNELAKSNGTNLVGSGLFSPSSGTFAIGSSTLIAGSLFQIVGSAPVASIFTYANTAQGAILTLGLNRATTVGNHTTVQNGDILGDIEFYGDDGTNFYNGARILAVVASAPSTNNLPTKLDFYTTLTSSPVLRMTIDQKGNIFGTAGTTSMTDGFFNIPSGAGVPSGTPTTYSGRVPMYYDSTNNKFYVYNGAWKSVTLT
jgi:hypothetical protein